MTTGSDWRGRLAELLPLYGHRNWIIIADAAFPAQVGAVEVLATEEEHLAVVREVVGAVRSARHVRPVVRLDRELDFLNDTLAPGTEATRSALGAELGDLNPTPEMHEELLARLAAVSAVYRVLVLKTTGTVPYSSVFLELDCGYWTPDQEQALRQAMA